MKEFQMLKSENYCNFIRSRLQAIQLQQFSNSAYQALNFLNFTWIFIIIVFKYI